MPMVNGEKVSIKDIDGALSSAALMTAAKAAVDAINWDKLPAQQGANGAYKTSGGTMTIVKRDGRNYRVGITVNVGMRTAKDRANELTPADLKLINSGKASAELRHRFATLLGMEIEPSDNVKDALLAQGKHVDEPIDDEPEGENIG